MLVGIICGSKVVNLHRVVVGGPNVAPVVWESVASRVEGSISLRLLALILCSNCSYLINIK